MRFSYNAIRLYGLNEYVLQTHEYELMIQIDQNFVAAAIESKIIKKIFKKYQLFRKYLTDKKERCYVLEKWVPQPPTCRLSYLWLAFVWETMQHQMQLNAIIRYEIFQRQRIKLCNH